jgi:hypothetical protein
MALLYHQALGSLFVASYDSQGYDGGIRLYLHTGSTATLKVSQSYTATDCQSVSLGAHDQIFFVI